MNKIIAVCTSNTCRSPMALGIIKAIAEENNIDDISVSSGGLSAEDGDAPTENAVLTLSEIGIDISNHRSRLIMSVDLREADCIYVMTEHHKNAIVDYLPEVEAKIIVMDIADPFGCDLEAYNNCRDKMLSYFTKELLGDVD